MSTSACKLTLHAWAVLMCFSLVLSRKCYGLLRTVWVSFSVAHTRTHMHPMSRKHRHVLLQPIYTTKTERQEVAAVWGDAEEEPACVLFLTPHLDIRATEAFDQRLRRLLQSFWNHPVYHMSLCCWGWVEQWPRCSHLLVLWRSPVSKHLHCHTLLSVVF